MSNDNDENVLRNVNDNDNPSLSPIVDGASPSAPPLAHSPNKSSSSASSSSSSVLKANHAPQHNAMDSMLRDKRGGAPQVCFV